MPVVTLTGELGLSRDVLGGKAWGIVRMLRLGIPVPPAFCITTDECAPWTRRGGPDTAITTALPEAIGELERATGRRFGHPERPLLVSVRSGAPVSMPGMMDTVLNLGMDDGIEAGLAGLTGDAAFAADTRRRFEEQYREVVGTPAPATPGAQLLGAIDAVFASWRSERAVTYRARHGIPEDLGTAVTVQAMVFGNLDDDSGTGVLFSRDPLTGDREPFGEWLPRAQGEDVVAGTHDPRPLAELARDHPAIHAELLHHARTLEVAHADMQDIEFTVESGRLWLLQTRSGKRSPAAAVRLAVAFGREGRISPEEALRRVRPEHVVALLREHVEPGARQAAGVVAAGRPACPGLARGVVVVDVDEAEERALDGEEVILARPVTTPRDLRAMAVVAGIVTELGGATSHAAVVSRELGVPCVVGVGEGAITVREGQEVTVAADEGRVYEGRLPVRVASEHDDEDLAQLLRWGRERVAVPPDAGLPEVLRALDGAAA